MRVLSWFCCFIPQRHLTICGDQLMLVCAGGSKSLDLESQFAVGMLGSRASLPSNGELSPVVHLTTANSGPPAAANGHVHSNGVLDAAALRQPPSYAADGGRASPAPSLPPPPLPPADPFAEQKLSPVLPSAGIDKQQAGLDHGGLNGQQRSSSNAQLARLDGSHSAAIDFLKEQSSSAPWDDGAMTWSEPDEAFQVCYYTLWLCPVCFVCCNSVSCQALSKLVLRETCLNQRRFAELVHLVRMCLLRADLRAGGGAQTGREVHGGIQRGPSAAADGRGRAARVRQSRPRSDREGAAGQLARSHHGILLSHPYVA